MFDDDLTVSNTELAEVSSLVSAILDVEGEVESLELALKERKEKLAQLKERELPDLMNQIGLSSFKTADGKKVSVKKDYKNTIINEEEAFRWLEETGNSSIIKTELKLNFGKGERELCQEAEKLLSDNNLSFNKKEGVNAMTLNAFTREQLEHGIQFPDCFSIYTVNKVTIK